MSARGRRAGWALLFALALLAGCTTAPAPYHAPPAMAAAERPAHNLAVFDRAWQLVNAKFFDAQFRGVDWAAQRAEFRPQAEQAPDDGALYLVINRMLGRLKESHLVALLPKNAYEFRTQHTAGIGIKMVEIAGQRAVSEVVPGSPAEGAGVRPGWIVLSRDGVPIAQAKPPTAAPGEPLSFAFLDAEDRPVALTLNAALVSFERREARALPDGAWYMRFDRFDVASLRWLSQQLKAQREAPAVILDLRQNPGGLTGALFLSLGEVFDHSVESGRFIRRGGGGSDWNSVALFSARYPGGLAVLVSNASASSSEIFAHVVQHHHRGVVVGRQTAGAVMGARFYRLPGGGRLEVPVNDYLGADGRRLEGRGVTPDVVVGRAGLTDLRHGRDPDVEAALTELRKARLISTN